MEGSPARFCLSHSTSHPCRTVLARHFHSWSCWGIVSPHTLMMINRSISVVYQCKPTSLSCPLHGLKWVQKKEKIFLSVCTWLSFPLNKQIRPLSLYEEKQLSMKPFRPCWTENVVLLWIRARRNLGRDFFRNKNEVLLARENQV